MPVVKRNNEPPISRPQFSLAAVSWSLLTFGLALAYLRRFDQAAVFLGGALVVAQASLLGAVVGLLFCRVAESVCWSVLVAILAYLSVAGEMSYGPAFRFAWSAVGSVVGAGCAVVAEKRPVLRMLVGLTGAGVTMGVYAALTGAAGSLAFDLVCAPVVGALVGLLIEIILWLERRSGLPRYMTAAWLLCAVIAGNLLVPVLLGAG